MNTIYSPIVEAVSPSFKLVAMFQYEENYGYTEGTQYWKYKGGAEVVLMDGITEQMLDDVEALIELVESSMEDTLSSMKWDNDSSRQYLIDYCVVPSHHWSEAERIVACNDWDEDLPNVPLPIEVLSFEPYMDMAEALGFEA